MTHPLLSVLPIRRLRQPPPLWRHGIVTHHWDHFIIVSHLTCCRLPSLHPLKLHSEVVPTACSPANQNTLTKQPCSPQLFPYIQHHLNQAAPCQIPPAQSQPQPCVILTLQIASPHLAVHTLTFTPQKPPESSFKVSKVHARVVSPLCSS